MYYVMTTMLAMTLKFLGTVNLDKVRGEKIIQERQPEADDILAEFSDEDLGFDTALFNPRKSTKSLPMFDDQVTYSQRPSRRR